MPLSVGALVGRRLLLCQINVGAVFFLKIGTGQLDTAKTRFGTGRLSARPVPSRPAVRPQYRSRLTGLKHGRRIESGSAASAAQRSEPLGGFQKKMKSFLALFLFCILTLSSARLLNGPPSGGASFFRNAFRFCQAKLFEVSLLLLQQTNPSKPRL